MVGPSLRGLPSEHLHNHGGPPCNRCTEMASTILRERELREFYLHVLLREWACACWRWLWVLLQLNLMILVVLVRGVTVGGAWSQELERWQLALNRMLPSRMLSRIFGRLSRITLPKWLRLPVLGVYVWLFGCRMEEAVVEDLGEYPNLFSLFTRTLKEEARPISPNHPLVSPADGTLLHYGRVSSSGLVEQVKGVTYSLEKLLGPGIAKKFNAKSGHLVTRSPELRNRNHTQEVNLGTGSRQSEYDCNANQLYYIIIYLGLGDYHHFHSPANWTVQMRRHIVGELLTVQPWATRLMPSLFALNERVVLSGRWECGFFSLTAVGAYNIGSIQLNFDEDLKTNLEKHEENKWAKTGEFSDKILSDPDSDSGEPPVFKKGDHLGRFNLGSSVVLVFEAPGNLQLVVAPGEKVVYGQAIGRIDSWTSDRDTESRQTLSI